MMSDRGEDLVSLHTVSLRDDVADTDLPHLRRLVQATGFFTPTEVDIAVELVEERLAKGDASGYHFLLADARCELVGYACFGPIPATTHSFDLYWIVVDRAYQGQGLGRRLLIEAEQWIRARGGRRVYVDTSGQSKYAPTRAFYQHCGYWRAAVLTDFYARGDDKVIFAKQLA